MTKIGIGSRAERDGDLRQKDDYNANNGVYVQSKIVIPI